MTNADEQHPLGEHRPAPAELRRASRTAWAPGRVVLWIGLQIALIVALVLAAWWFLGRPAPH